MGIGHRPPWAYLTFLRTAIVSKRSGKMLHVLNGSTADNAEIVQHTK